MKNLLSKHWGIKANEIKKLRIEKSPLSKSKEWLVNDTFVLKAQYPPPDMSLQRILLNKGVPILVPRDWNSVKHEGLHYMVFDYAHSKRIEYSKELDKAKEIAQALAKISSVVTGAETVDLRENLTKLAHCSKNQKVHKAFFHIRKQFFPYLEYFEQKFSHGDFHPSNLLWNDGLKIIDWEIAGVREELYDLAFLVGCIGMDHPSELQNEFVIRLIKNYAENAKPTKLSAVLFPELVLATRLEWMPVWEETADKEMIDLEATYIELILCNIEKLRKFWLGLFGDCKYSEHNWVMQDAHLKDEIIRAQKRLKGSDISVLADQKPVERSSTDLRLLAIDAGMHDDIVGVIKALEIQKKLSSSHASHHIQIERGLTMGNSTLDFSKFRMKKALDKIIREYHKLVKKDIAELRIGFSFILRNCSIFYAEIGDMEKVMHLVEEQIHFAKENSHVEIQGELARTLSNAIATLLDTQKHNDKIDLFFGMLLALKEKHPDSEKIDVANKVAETNMKRYSV